MVSHELSKPRRIELILRQIDTLPTLPAVAMRLLTLTSDDDASAREVVRLIQSDPSLTAKVLSLCRTADKGVRGDVLTVDRAVVLLGFSAIRNAVLSVSVFEAFGGRVDGDLDTPGSSAKGTGNREQAAGNRQQGTGNREQGTGGIRSSPTSNPQLPIPVSGGASGGVSGGGGGLDRKGFWLHSLAVALAAECIARAHHDRELPADEAFVCGLLHDIGKLALDHALPRSYSRIAELAELHHDDISVYERKIIGLDHHTAGKRLAEQWRLPLRLQDCIWLHGAPLESLPQLAHRRMIGLVKLADAVARQSHIGYSGNQTSADVDAMAKTLGLSPDKVRAATANLFDLLEERGRALGIHDEPSRELALGAIQRANTALGRANAALERRGRLAAAQGRVLETLADFNASAMPAGSVQDALDGVVASARGLLGEGFYAVLYPVRDAMMHAPDQPPRPEGYWLVAQYDRAGEPFDARYIETPPHTPDLAGLDASRLPGAGLELMGVLPWIAEHLPGSDDLGQVRMLPLPCGWGTVAVLLHDAPHTRPRKLRSDFEEMRDEQGTLSGDTFGVESGGDSGGGGLPGWGVLGPLVSTWGNAVAAAAQHGGARRLSEELATANTALASAQEKLADTQSLARLGEMAAGAAHEMNNPLAVICGRSQVLSMTLPSGSDVQKSAQLIFRESHRLSDLITCLRMFADPPRAERRPTDVATLVKGVVAKVRSAASKSEVPYRMEMRPATRLGPLPIDGDQIDRAVTELLFNAVQANPKSAVLVTLKLDPPPPPEGTAHADAEPLGAKRLVPPQITPRTLIIQVADDGEGMDEHTLRHAPDPFFSAKPAGRQVGMGLPRAQQLAAAHGGTVELRSTPGLGTVATLSIPLDSPAQSPDEAVMNMPPGLVA